MYFYVAYFFNLLWKKLAGKVQSTDTSDALSDSTNAQGTLRTEQASQGTLRTEQAFFFIFQKSCQQHDGNME